MTEEKKKKIELRRMRDAVERRRVRNREMAAAAFAGCVVASLLISFLGAVAVLTKTYLDNKETHRQYETERANLIIRQGGRS